MSDEEEDNVYSFRQRDDETWTPKIKMKINEVKTERPTRNRKRNSAVAKYLEAAALKRADTRISVYIYFIIFTKIFKNLLMKESFFKISQKVTVCRNFPKITLAFSVNSSKIIISKFLSGFFCILLKRLQCFPTINPSTSHWSE